MFHHFWESNPGSLVPTSNIYIIVDRIVRYHHVVEYINKIKYFINNFLKF